MAILLVEIDDDTCVAPYHVVKLRVGRNSDMGRPHQWGVFVTFVTGETWFRPSEDDTQSSARTLMNAWRRACNEWV